MIMYKYLAFGLFIITISGAFISISLCLFFEQGSVCNIVIEKIDSNLATILATITGSLATCTLFLYQKYEFDTNLKRIELQDKKKSIYELIEKLNLEKDRLLIPYPYIDELWQTPYQRKTEKGVKVFSQIYKIAQTLLKNLNWPCYLTYDESIAQLQHKVLSDEILRWTNCPNVEESLYAEQNFNSIKKQMYQGLCNVFVELNEAVYNINHCKSEEVKRELCAYYILKTYQHYLSKYFDLLSVISLKLQELKKDYEKKDIEDTMDYVHSNFSPKEQKLLEEYIVLKKPILKNLF